MPLDFQLNIFLFFINLICYGNNINRANTEGPFPLQSISTNSCVLIGLAKAAMDVEETQRDISDVMKNLLVDLFRRSQVTQVEFS